MYVRRPTISYTFWLSRWGEGKERKPRWSEEQPAGNLWLSKFVTCHCNLQGLTQDLAGKKAMIQQAYNFCLLAIIGPVYEKAALLEIDHRECCLSQRLVDFITLVVTAFFSVFLSLGARWCNHVPPKSEEGPGFTAMSFDMTPLSCWVITRNRLLCDGGDWRGLRWDMNRVLSWMLRVLCRPPYCGYR